MLRKTDPLVILAFFCSTVILLFIILPLAEMVFQPSLSSLYETIQDKDVLRSIWLSLYASGLAAVISFVFGTPFAYLLARGNFRGKRFVESVVDIPIMVPHPIIGIAMLSLVGREHWFGKVMQSLGVRIMGSVTGIVVVLTFVGLPFYVNAVKTGFEAVPVRLENVSRSLGASMAGTFFRVTFPLAGRSMLVGMIMCMARALSEFGAVVIVAYHPMIAPVLMYERFTAYGLAYSQPVAVWLILISLLLFFILRVVTTPRQSDQ